MPRPGSRATAGRAGDVGSAAGRGGCGASGLSSSEKRDLSQREPPGRVSTDGGISLPGFASTKPGGAGAGDGAGMLDAGRTEG
ncbi:hypothetical protein KOI35_34190 [Actinoplanes bogorensis]|uniref:Uncharacterized protein n=1 Tax=Paractinoplanes bogorensis TaxID=1610840 RepID=A0ABS5YYQ7_9ACTN|nr:hypothetical protein [Actinoplanes bogorensis]MBU2668575.1 hypothetical protein [Actinoplanes bogorensis]